MFKQIIKFIFGILSVFLFSSCSFNSNANSGLPQFTPSDSKSITPSITLSTAIITKTPYPINAVTQTHFPIGIVEQMVFDYEGYLWTIGAAGVLRWNPEKKTTVEGSLPGESSKFIQVAPNGAVWIGTSEYLAYFQGDVWTETLSLDYSQIDFKTAKIPSDIEKHQGFLTPLLLGFDKDNNLYWILATSGLYFRQGEIWEIVPDSFLIATDYFLGLNAVDGNIWFAHYGCCSNPIKAYKFDGKQLTNVPEMDEVHFIVQTADGKIWATEFDFDSCETDSKIKSYDGTSWQTETGLFGLGLATGSDGNLWFINCEGVFRSDGEKIIEKLPLPDNDQLHEILEIGGGWWSIKLIIGPDNTPWLSFTRKPGLWHYTGKAWERFP